MISPLKVIYARAPRLALLGYRISRVLETGLSLDSELESDDLVSLVLQKAV